MKKMRKESNGVDFGATVSGGGGGGDVSKKIERVELVCSDDVNIVIKDSDTPLTYDDVKSLVDDTTKFVTLRYLDIWWMLPSYDDGGAIMFTSTDITNGHAEVTRVVMNTEGQLSNYTIITEDSDHKTDDLTKETAADGHFTYPTTHAVNQGLTALGLELSEIKEQLGEGGGSAVDAYTKAESDERFADKIIDVTDSKTRHEELLGGRKIVTIDKDLDWPTYICVGKNLLTYKPKFIGTDPGVVISIDGAGRVNSKGTMAKTNFNLCFQDETWNLPVWKEVAGKSVVLCSMGCTGNTAITFNMTDGSEKQYKVLSSHGVFVQSTPIVVPDNVRYVRVSCNVYGNEGEYIDSTKWVGLYLVDEGVPTPCEAEFITHDNVVDSCFYNSVVRTYASTKEYIDKKAIGGLYVIPEKFGAKGDGVTDDSDAIASALAYAKAKNLPIKMYQTYLVSSPVTIDGDGMDVEIYGVVNKTAGSTAILINAKNTSIRIKTIESANIGIKVIGGTHNTINVEKIKSNHGIVFTGEYATWQNGITFRDIEGLGVSSTCINSHDFLVDGHSFVTENTFYGGHCRNAGTGYKGLCGNSKLYNIQFENLLGTAYHIFNEGTILIEGDRHSEQAMSTSPLIKISSDDAVPTSKSADEPRLTYKTVETISINQIDASENYTSCYVNESLGNQAISERCKSVIEGEIRCYRRISGTGGPNFTTLAHRAYIWGKKIICVPHRETRYDVKASLFDISHNDETLSVLPTTFVIKSANCVVKLHDSYCHLGFNKFRVIQDETHKAKIVNSDGKLVWDGWTKGAGTFQFEICATNEDGFNISYRSPQYDGNGVAWYVNDEKQTLVDYNE